MKIASCDTRETVPVERLGWTMMKRAASNAFCWKIRLLPSSSRSDCFDFNENDELVEVRDCVNNALRYEYANHLLVRETDRIGFSFYFRDDNEGWCRGKPGVTADCCKSTLITTGRTVVLGYVTPKGISISIVGV